MLTPYQRDLIARHAAELRRADRDRIETRKLGALMLASAAFVFYGWAVLLGAVL